MLYTSISSILLFDLGEALVVLLVSERKWWSESEKNISHLHYFGQQYVLYHICELDCGHN